MIIVGCTRAFPDSKVGDGNPHLKFLILRDGFIQWINLIAGIIINSVAGIVLTEADSVVLVLKSSDLAVGILPGFANTVITCPGCAGFLFWCSLK